MKMPAMKPTTGGFAGVSDDVSLLEEERMLPSQFGRRDVIPLTPERLLWIAVLERSLRDALHGSRKALAWFESMDEMPLSFRWVVSLLGRDPDAFARTVRTRLAQVKVRGVHRRRN